MNTRLGNGLTACALMTAAAFSVGAGPAAAKGDGARASRCDRGGYEVRGTAEVGSVLRRVAGAQTARRADDRYSGSLVVDVLRGNRRGRRDLGVHRYSVTSVRLPGAPATGDIIPAEGSAISLGGKLTGGRGCAASAHARRAEVDDVPQPSDTPEGTTPPVADVTVDGDAPLVADVAVRVVRLAPEEVDGTAGAESGDDAPRSSGDRRAGEDPAGVDRDRPAPRDAADDEDDRPDPAAQPDDDDDRGGSSAPDEREEDEGA